MPKVTVIIPNFNHGRFLEKRIQSVLNQTYQDFEVIYIDDASTDDSNEIFSKFEGDKRIRTVYNTNNSGIPFRQWNKGVRMAKGEYIWMAESDDYADERFLEQLVERLDKSPTVGLAYCQSWRIDEFDNIIGSWEEWTADLDQKRWKRDYVNNGRDECIRYQIMKNTIPNASAVLIRRSIYEKVGYADESMKFGGDWLMWIKMLLISDIAFLAEPLNYFRRHPETVMKRTVLTGIEQEEAYRILRYVGSKLNIRNELLDKRCDTIMDKWVELAFSRQGQIPWSYNRNIYEIARDVDPKLKRRLVRKTFSRLLEISTDYGKGYVRSVCSTLGRHLLR